MAKREYEKPSVTVDCVALKHGPEGRTEVLLIQRTKDPFAGKWALPGGFVNKDEPLHIAARRELQEETGLHVTKLRQLAEHLWVADRPQTFYGLPVGTRMTVIRLAGERLLPGALAGHRRPAAGPLRLPEVVQGFPSAALKCRYFLSHPSWG